MTQKEFNTKITKQASELLEKASNKTHIPKIHLVSDLITKYLKNV